MTRAAILRIIALCTADGIACASCGTVAFVGVRDVISRADPYFIIIGGAIVFGLLWAAIRTFTHPVSK